jgi:hypothetical protein
MPSPALLLGGLLLLIVAADLARRLLPSRSGQPAARAGSEASPAAAGETSRPDPPAADPRAGVYGRAATLGRVVSEGGGTYLPDMLRMDSTLRRWPDERLASALPVAVVRTPRVAGFREDFVSNVAWAVGRWNGALLPVQLRIGADSAEAAVVVTWTERLDSTVTGRTSVTWDQYGRIRHALVVLATHDPNGRTFEGREMVSLALHELGHALGLNHSPVRADAMYPRTVATELTERDLRTARLLYSLPPGSVRD